jgi:hypothetical protein
MVEESRREPIRKAVFEAPTANEHAERTFFQEKKKLWSLANIKKWNSIRRMTLNRSFEAEG